MTELKEDKDLGLRLCKSCMRLQGRVAELRNRDWHGDVFDEEKQA